ncbi:hypothetical protein ABC382_00730 [Lysinibacillus sp. 1P01SD]|uniref:hypothetical protein n=1 Tax=Lysinibacillus sp. 1P01SD TaxID=3132285 RepID=UPI0039A0B236
MVSKVIYNNGNSKCLVEVEGDIITITQETDGDEKKHSIHLYEDELQKIGELVVKNKRKDELYSVATKDLLCKLSDTPKNTVDSIVINTDYKKSSNQTLDFFDFLTELRSVFLKYGIVAIEDGIIAYNKEVDRIGISKAHIITEAEDIQLGKPLFTLEMNK